MKLNLILTILALTLSGCATSTFDPTTRPGTSPTTNTTASETPESSSRPSSANATRPPIVVSRIEPGTATNNILSEAIAAREGGHFEQALLLLERAQRITPQAGEVYLEMARVKRQLGQLGKAEQLCLKAISLSGKDLRFRRQVMQEIEFVRRAQRAAAATG